MQLLIVRHGEAESYATSDSERSLTHYGIEQARLAGKCVKQLSLSFDCIWVSPFVRAQQTANELLAAADMTMVHREVISFITPDSSPEKSLLAIEHANIEKLMIISHQPLVSTMAGLLEASQSYAGPPMSTASMLLLEADIMMQGCADRIWLRHAPTYERSE